MHGGSPCVPRVRLSVARRGSASWPQGRDLDALQDTKYALNDTKVSREICGHATRNEFFARNTTD